MVLELLKGVALLLALCYLETFIWRCFRERRLARNVMFGLLFGIICVIGMMAPLRFADGIIFDARSVIIAVSGLFGGPVAGVVAAAVAGAYRWSLGGAGAFVGVGVILTSLAAGLLYRYGRERFGWAVDVPRLFVFGLLLHIACLGWFMLLPGDAPARILETLAVPFVAVFTPATVMLGWLISDSHRQIRTAEELKAATDALAESERRFRAIVDNSPSGITLKDADGRYLMVNQAFARWQNLKPEEIIGKRIADIVSDDQAAAINSQEEEIVRDGQIRFGESTRDFADGVHRSVNVTKVPVTLAGGGPRVVLTILTDVTAEKRVEEELRRARDEAVEANKTKSDFLARMSHEFRTPLNAILGFSDILANQHIVNLEAGRASGYAKDIHASAEMLLELVNDLLDIAAIEEGRIRLDYEDVDIRSTVEEGLRNIDARVQEKRIALDVAFPETIKSIAADRRALKQILLNLVTNAIKFTPEDGEIRLDVTQTPVETTLKVSDTGIGIEAGLLRDLMRPDARLAANSYRSDEGWGLGLAIVRGLAELHGGRMDIQSTPGRGTSVVVTLPNASATPTVQIAG
ncbi:MAG: LytS/YhcK type 5TM receptor domain-containing protein [Rhodospirillales bacterium]